MKSVKTVPNDKKLTILYRIEPGCLGPDGKARIEEFCRFSEEKMRDLDSWFLNWDIQPRNDKALPEVQFQLLGKKISYQQASTYMELFDKNIELFSEDVDDEMANFIELFLKK